MNIEDVLQLPFNESIVQKTTEYTIQKYKNTMVNLMYNRKPVELLDNIYMGDLAKNSVFYYLKNKISKPIIDYDEIREDNFKDADPGWDFLIGDKKVKVEVKSSIPPKGESKQNIIRQRDIKITASHDKGHTWIQPENLVSDIHIQIYFYAQIYRKGYTDHKKLYTDIINNSETIKNIINVNKYSKPLFFGWSTKKEIVKYKKTLNPNYWTFSWTNRMYWRCPISQAHNMNKLIDIINNKL